MKYLCLALLLVFLLPAKVVKISPVQAEQPPALKTVQNAPQSEIQPLNDTLTTSFSVRQYVEIQANALGVDPTDALWIVSHESQDGTNLYGDDGQSVGPWMISTVYHPEVGKECSLSLQCSTSWSLAHIIDGGIEQWTTWACRYAFYPDATSTLGPAPSSYVEPKYCRPVMK